VAVAKNPYRPGVGTEPLYLADRERQLARFRGYVDDFPERRQNIRLTGLRGVGKTVLLKEYRKEALRRNWTVIRRDVNGRLRAEGDFAVAIADDLQEAAEAFSKLAVVKRIIGDTRKAIGEITVGFGVELTVDVGGSSGRTSVLEDRVKNALLRVGKLAKSAGSGVLFLYDEAHTIYDRPKKRQFPLSALLGAFVQTQDDENELPVMLVVCGLPPLVTNLQRARSHSERLFRAEELGNLTLSQENDDFSPAALALVKPAQGTEIRYEDETAERIVRDVDGYPYFIQKYGEALFDAARAAADATIDLHLYRSVKKLVQDDLDREFFEGRYDDASASDQMTLRVAGSMGAENFQFGELAAQLESRKPNATQQSVNRLLVGNLIYRVRHGEYAYTAPLFGDFLRRKHPRADDDR
jgi:AAA ATPase domain